MKDIRHILIVFMAVLGSAMPIYAQDQAETTEAVPTDAKEKKTVRKVLFIGDSMTGWLAESLNAYGKENGFEVATVVWDGSTISRWGSSPRLPQLIGEQKPDAVFVSLGMNELFDTAPSKKLQLPMTRILEAVGDLPMVWVGPPSWPGHDKGEVLNGWLEKKLGSDVFFRSFDLKLPRQSARNPHPTREGMIQWIDAVMEWVPEHSNVRFPSVRKPSKERMVRGKTFIYKRMKETL